MDHKGRTNSNYASADLGKKNASMVAEHDESIKTDPEGRTDEDTQAEKDHRDVGFFKKHGYSQGLIVILRGVTIEPMVFFAVFGLLLQYIPTSYLIMERVCTVQEGYSFKKCQEILYDKNTPSECRKNIQEKVTTWMIISTAIGFFPEVLIKLVAGSWSDKYGRKPVMIMALTGFLLRSILSLFVVHYKNAGVVWIILAAFPTSLFATSVALPISIAYLSDLSSTEARTARILIMEFAALASVIIAQFASGAISQAYGYETVFLLSFVFAALAFFYCLLFVKETVLNNDGLLKKLKNVFNVRHIISSFKTLAKQRQGYIRLHLLLLVVASLFDQLIVGCHSALDIYYTQKRYSWTAFQYGKMVSITLVVRAAMFSIGGFLFIKKLKLIDIKIALIGFTSGTLGYAICGLAYYPWLFYVGKFAESWFSLPDIIIQSRLTKLVETSEIGKMMTIRSAINALAGPETNIAFVALYKLSLNFFVGFPYLLSACLYVIPFTFFAIMHFKPIEENKTPVSNEIQSKENDVSLEMQPMEKTLKKQ